MAGGRARTFVQNIGAARRVSYIPPNGQWMEAGETIIVPGILETELHLAKNEAFDDYVADLAASQIRVTYDFAEATDTPSIITSTLTQSDKDLVPNATSPANGQDTGLSISETPYGDSMVEIFVNTVRSSLGDGVKTKAFYFSDDGGTTAKLISDIQAGDSLFMNCVIAGYVLDSSDRISMMYMVLAGASSSSSP